jgi:hypothetical protein
MIKYFLIVFALFSPNLSAYQSLKKYYGFDDIKDKDDICKFTYASVDYVRPCKEGKYCKDFGGISLCVDIKEKVTKNSIGKTCSITSECLSGLTCDNTCKSTCSSLPDFINDSAYYDCRDSHVPEGSYYYWEFDSNDNPKTTYPYTNNIDIFKVGGKIHFHPKKLSDNSYQYFVEKKELAYIGTIEDNVFVDDPLACSSGFAIKVYPDGSLKNPSSIATPPNMKYYKCVTVKDIGYDDENNCYIKYGDNNEIFFGDDYSETCDEKLLTKLKLFKKYIEVYTPDKQKSCDKSENYNEPFTCNEDELRKWYHFYVHPENYLLYYNEKDEVGTDITTYLIQEEYNSYQSSDILKIKYIIMLLLLLSF